MFKCTKSLPKNKHFVIATFPIQFSSSVVNETSNLIQREANILAALLLSQDHNANQLNCRDMSGGLLEGYFFGEEDYSVLRKPHSEEEKSPSRRQINW